MTLRVKVMFDNPGINAHLLAHIPINARVLLFVGSGDGSLVDIYRRRNPGAFCFAVERQRGLAEKARPCFRRIIVGNLEREAVFKACVEMLDGMMPDVMVIGDQCLAWRHPVSVLKRLYDLLTPDGSGLLLAENKRSWKYLLDWLNDGRQDMGKLQQPEHALSQQQLHRLLASAGLHPLEKMPIKGQVKISSVVLDSVRELAGALKIDPESMIRNLTVSHWSFEFAKAKPRQKLSVSALGLRKVAGVTEARIDFPMAALESLPGVSAVWSSEGLSVSNRRGPGIIVLHRQFLVDQGFVAKLEELASKGWVLTMDMDDDPHHWKEFVNSDFYAFRAVHAVTVSTENLARMIRQWNAKVKVFPNAIFELPKDTSTGYPEKIRVFYGALNRGKDWAAIRDALFSAFEQLSAKIEIVVVHDRAFFEALPEIVQKEFSDTLPPSKYLEMLASCDIALLPLEDTSFNNLKSDIKFIECCAAKVVPLCSPVIYADNPAHRDIGLFARTPEDWRRNLLQLCQKTGEIRERQERGFQYVTENRMHAHQVQGRAAFYADLLGNREELEKERRQRLRVIQAGPGR